MKANSDRRDFIKAGAAAAAVSLLPTAVHAAGNDVIKVGLIGCGGRGTGAAKNILEADKSVHIHAVGDAFQERADGCLNSLTNDSTLKKIAGDRINVGERKFAGLDAYQKVIDSGADLIILATPPGFRPMHLEAAINAGKNIFTEKPVAVDAAGIRKVLALAKVAKEKGLAVAAGTQRRHQAGYIETINQIQGGKIGKVVSARCAWNGQGIWFHPRRPGEADAAYQLRNWYHFLWLCGDHIVEQHVHNLDVINWVMNAHPVKAVGFGGRSPGNTSRPSGDPKEVGQIWDHFAVEYEYPNGVPLYSYCAHLPGIKSDVSETVYGSAGSSRVNAYVVNKTKVFDKDETNPYVQEHIDLIQSIRAGKPINELQQVAESTFTAILGREAAYTGNEVRWDDFLKSGESTMPEGLTLASSISVSPAPQYGAKAAPKKARRNKA